MPVNVLISTRLSIAKDSTVDTSSPDKIYFERDVYQNSIANDSHHVPRLCKPDVTENS